MIDEADPFAAFKEGQAAPDTTKSEKPARKKREKKAKTNGKEPTKAVADKPKKERKARKLRASKEMKLPISALLEIGPFTGEESGALLSISAGLQKMPKRSRPPLNPLRFQPLYLLAKSECHSRVGGNPEPQHARPRLDARLRGHDSLDSEKPFRVS